MARDLFEDDALTDSTRLLSQYRQMCKMLGAAQVTGEAVSREALQQISRIEAELQTRLWLAEGGRPSPAGEPVAGSPGDARPRLRSTPDTNRVAPDSAPWPQPSLPTGGAATVFADGSCLGNPGPGGFGTIVRVPGQKERVISAGKGRTTNNEMELTGAAEGLRAAISGGATEITVVTDSEYLVKGMNSWMKGWLRNGWKTRTGDPVKNKDLWEELHRLVQGRAVTWTWVPGHAGHPENERCNSLAVAAAQKAANPTAR